MNREKQNKKVIKVDVRARACACDREKILISSFVER
jgi:hypothetical protein